MLVGANNYFSAGFDVNEFLKPGNAEQLSKDVQVGFSKYLECGVKPTVAAISDTCLGGGCELAVACNGRVCT